MISEPQTSSFSYNVKMAMVVARREVRDSFRDWRIMIPIFMLTFFFPGLMNFTARRILAFVGQYDAAIVATQLVPFLLLVVGFFPTSFSLIIALETFVGERERKSMEPLLSTPLTDVQLYFGKMMSSIVPPLTASYTGMIVYMLGLLFTIGWDPSFELVVQIFLLTTMQGLIMVAGAVVISSQTTSVRAANLLASFIIVPMALLLQAEAMALFWGYHAGIWWMILGLAVTAVILMRMGTESFNREGLMGQEIDNLHPKLMGGRMWARFTGRGENGRYPHPLNWYKQTFGLLPTLGYPVLLLLLSLIGGLAVGAMLGYQYKFPAEAQAILTNSNWSENMDALQGLTAVLPRLIIFQNIRVLILGALLGVFSFGVLAVMVFMVPWVLIGYLAAQLAIVGQNPLLFGLATIAPHAIVELPAILLATGAALRWHVGIMAPAEGGTIGDAFLDNMTDFFRIFIGLTIPLLILSALLESYLTPQVISLVYGG